MTELQIDDELKAWIDPLSADEYSMLEASILQEGCRDPLVVWGNYLLDGHNRYAICQQHGISFQTYEKTGLLTKADVKIWMIENQLGKRNATDYVRAALALKLKPLLEQRAKDRMMAGRPDPVQNSAQGVGKTRDVIAKAAGVSHDTVRKVEQIEASATPEVKAAVRAGEISINAAAKTLPPSNKTAPPGAAERANSSDGPPPVPTDAGIPTSQPAPSTNGGSTEPEPDELALNGGLDGLVDDTPDFIELLRAEEEKVRLLTEQVATLTSEIERLRTADHAAEAESWHYKFDQLSNRNRDLQGKVVTSQEEADSYKNELTKIQKMMGLKTIWDIKPALAAKGNAR
ncbi:hypothetical protein [Massilia aquatica]|uniref:Plasmid replication/partition related protein n=1 Tax=Massilia aquatica TaxID=2609000 RepID=A0ABX0M7H0_9BURK|nr:hypothetical protein [Massilia aquatica]NHZ40096.1 hypothetical protein [Massilia aquatica]